MSLHDVGVSESSILKQRSCHIWYWNWKQTPTSRCPKESKYSRWRFRISSVMRPLQRCMQPVTAVLLGQKQDISSFRPVIHLLFTDRTIVLWGNSNFNFRFAIKLVYVEPMSDVVIYNCVCMNLLMIGGEELNTVKGHKYAMFFDLVRGGSYEGGNFWMDSFEFFLLSFLI